MTKQELDAKVSEISGGDDSPEEKSRRINLLNKVFANIQTQEADAKKQKQQDAEARLKNSLQTAYMSNDAATIEDFERDYPQLKSDYLRNEAMRQDEAVRASMGRRYFDI